MSSDDIDLRIASAFGVLRRSLKEIYSQGQEKTNPEILNECLSAAALTSELQEHDKNLPGQLNHLLYVTGRIGKHKAKLSGYYRLQTRMEEIYQRNKARRAAVEATLLLMKECEAHEKEIEDERSKRKFREQAGVSAEAGPYKRCRFEELYARKPVAFNHRGHALGPGANGLPSAAVAKGVTKEVPWHIDA